MDIAELSSYAEKFRNIVQTVDDNAQVADSQGKKEIELPQDGKVISEFAIEIAQHLKQKNDLFFRPRERKLVKIEMLPIDAEGKKIIGFKDMEPAAFVTYIEKFFSPGIMRKNNKTGENFFIQKSLTMQGANIVLESAQLQDNLPVIDKIYTVPMPILKDGKLTFPKAGYDSELWSWLPNDAPKINTDMSLDEAKEILDRIYDEFCFKCDQDRVNAIAGLITPYLRGLYSRPTCRTPIFFYKANRERAGKDYCADITGIVYYGEAADETPIADGKEVHDEEFRKKVLSTFRSGRNRIHLSNNKGYINSAQLEAMSTNENFTDRVLGSNTMLTFPNTLEISMSANCGITYTPDLANRCVFVNLFLELEDPNNREFCNPDLHGWVRNNRDSIISALFALVRNWVEKGLPKGKTPFASFHEWADICGGIMFAADLGDPCKQNDEAASIGGDSETRDMKHLFELCNEKWGEAWVKKKQIMDALVDEEDFSELFGFLKLQQQDDRKKFGIMFEKYVGRVFSNIILLRQDNKHTERRNYRFAKVTNDNCKTRKIGQKKLVEGLPKGGGDGGDGGFYPPQISVEKKDNNTGSMPNTPIYPNTPTFDGLNNTSTNPLEDIYCILFDAKDKKKDIVSITKLGFTDEQIEQGKTEGRWYELPAGTIKLI